MQLSQLFKFTPDDQANEQALLHHAQKSSAGFLQMISNRRLFLQMCSNQLKEMARQKAECQVNNKQLTDLYTAIKMIEDFGKEEQQLQTDMMRRLQMQEKLIGSICSLIGSNSKNSRNEERQELNNRNKRRMLKALCDTHQMTNKHWLNIEGSRGNILKK